MFLPWCSKTESQNEFWEEEALGKRWGLKCRQISRYEKLDRSSKA